MQPYKYFSLLLLISLVSTAAFSQSCYIQLQDASGLNNDAYQSNLEAAACALVGALPAEFQDQFKVYDFGFYLHNEVMEGGFPAAFNQVITTVEAQSPYYLLFGKQTDKNGVYSRFWVDLKLPKTGNFECMEEVEREIYKGQVVRTIMAEYALNNNQYPYYKEAEVAGINLLKRYVIEIVGCCNNTELKNETCNSCIDVETMRGFMEDNGFVSFPVDVLTHSSKNLTGVVNEYTQMEFVIGSDNLDVNADIVPFFTNVAEKIPNIKSNIYFYDRFGEYCLDIQNLVGGFEDSAITQSGDDDAKDDFTEENYLFQLDVIGTIGEDGSQMMHIRYKGAELPASVETGTIHFVFIDDPQVPINKTSVKNYLIEFYNIIDVPVNIEIAPSSPVTFNLTNLDGVAFIGLPSKILEYAVFTVDGFRVRHMYLNNFRNLNVLNPEIGNAFFRICFVRTRNTAAFSTDAISLANDGVTENFQCDNFEHLLGFLCFHSTGHFSYKHDHPDLPSGPKEDLGYMDTGSNIIKMLQLNFEENLGLKINAGLTEGEPASIRDLVQFTKMNYEETISIIWHIFNQITIGN